MQKGLAFLSSLILLPSSFSSPVSANIRKAIEKQVGQRSAVGLQLGFRNNALRQGTTMPLKWIAA
ncbi:MAG: hypothetical protein M3Q46_03320 [Verrucomicrobiota bacterium]|nr:hypothetical protein [Verrucomicrobiota bacterium]